MTIIMEIDTENDLIIRKIIGRITLNRIIKAHEETPRHPHFRPGMDVIWELSQAEVGHFASLDLMTLSNFIIQQVSWRGSHFKLAIVAPKEVSFIVSSTFSIIGQIQDLPIDVRVFKNFEKAFEWIISKKTSKNKSPQNESIPIPIDQS